MSDRYPGGVISKTPPTVTPPGANGEGGSASGVWSLSEVLEYEEASAWPKRAIPRELYAWGANSWGEVGNNATADVSSPVQIGSLTNWDELSAGALFSASVKTDGTMWIWGISANGRLGHNISNLGNANSRSSPIQIGALTNWSKPSLGNAHSIHIKTDNTLWTWGSASDGKLGDGTVSDKSSPVQVGGAEWSIGSAGQYHSHGIKTDGSLWAWGDPGAGMLGDNQTTVKKSSPIQIGSLTTWSDVNAGNQCAVALKTDGTLWAWGLNAYGQLGNNNTIARSSPVQVGALTDWSSFSIFNKHVVAIKTDGTLWTWGQNFSGELGDNSTVAKSSPVQIGALTTWVRASAGSDITMATRTDGTLWITGRNDNGQTGLNEGGGGAAGFRSSPTQIGSNTNWNKISAGNKVNLATTLD